MIASAAYQVIYDAAQVRFPAWPVASLGLVVAASGIGLGAYFRHHAIGSPAARIVVTSAIIFGVSWALLVGGNLSRGRLFQRQTGNDAADLDAVK